MRNTYKVISALSILALLIGVFFYYSKPAVGLSHSQLLSLRKKARSDSGTLHSGQEKAGSSVAVNTGGSAAVNPQPSIINGQVDPWHDVRVLLIGKNIKLTESETALLQAFYAELVNDREALELTIATRQKIDETKTLITIPPYADAGTELYANFIRDVTKDFGVSRADQILDALDSSILACNFGLGQQPQAILVEDQQRMFKISRGRNSIAVQVDGQVVHLPEFNASGFYEKDQLNAFAYLKPLLISSN